MGDTGLIGGAYSDADRFLRLLKRAFEIGSQRMINSFTCCDDESPIVDQAEQYLKLAETEQNRRAAIAGQLHSLAGEIDESLAVIYEHSRRLFVQFEWVYRKLGKFKLLNGSEGYSSLASIWLLGSDTSVWASQMSCLWRDSTIGLAIETTEVFKSTVSACPISEALLQQIHARIDAEVTVLPPDQEREESEDPREVEDYKFREKEGPKRSYNTIKHLSKLQFEKDDIRRYAKKKGLQLQQGTDFIKIGRAYAYSWKLVEKVAKSKGLEI